MLLLTLESISHVEIIENRLLDDACNGIRIGRKWFAMLGAMDRIAHVRDANTLNHPRIAERRRHAREMIEKSNSGPKKNGRDVDMDFIEQPAVQ